MNALSASVGQLNFTLRCYGAAFIIYLLLWDPYVACSQDHTQPDRHSNTKLPDAPQWMVKTDNESIAARVSHDFVEYGIQSQTRRLGNAGVLLTFHAHDTSILKSVLTRYGERVGTLMRDFTGKADSWCEEEVPSDPLFPRQWYLRNDGQVNGYLAVAGADINAINAWTLSEGSDAVVVAIIDSGISADNIEFNGRLWENPGETANDNQDNDGNGYVDDVHGFDFVNEGSDPADEHNHGTFIAGIVGAARNNDQLVTGINSSSRLMICKVLDRSLTGKYSDWIEAIYYAVDNGASVINMSVSGQDHSPLLEEAVKYAYNKGVAIFTSMGNQASDQLNYPAAYTQTIAVGSSNPDDTRSDTFSNFGNYIDFLAPGRGIVGLIREDGQVTTYSGTSMSSAVACGVGSLLLSIAPSLSPDQLETAMAITARDEIGDPQEDQPGWDRYYGYGRIDAFAALEAVIRGPVSRDILAIAPNPAPRQMVKVTISLPSLAGVSIDILDHTGRLLKTIPVLPESRTIDLEIPMTDYGAGLYFMRASTTNLTALSRFMVY